MLCILFKYSLSCALVGILFLDAYTLCIVHWLCVGHASGLHWAYWLVCPDVHSKCEWALGSYFIVIACLVKSWFISHSILLDRIVLVSYAITSFSTYNDDIVLLCFKRFLFIWFKSLLDSRVRCEWVLFNSSQLTY